MPDFILDGRLWETERQVPLFHTKVKIYIMQEDDSPPAQRQREILESLDTLPESFLLDVATHALAYYRQVDSVVNLSGEGCVIDERDIEQHYTIKSVLIPEIGNCETDYMFISADCDWEEEHGMQLLVADGQVIACGDSSTLPFSSLWKNVISSPKEKQGELLKKYLA